MAVRSWTPAQQNAINARGGTVLVSAAAGSGKTAVLVERILKRLTDPDNPVAANRLLVVTFTKAAAAEMQQRLAKGLDELLQADPTNPLLRRQTLMLPTAHISTTHAFCASLLRDQFHLLGLSPDFKVLEEKQAALLAEEALSEYMEEAYARHDPDFLLLADSLGSSRDDRELAAAIRQLYTFAASFPFPDDWLEAQLSGAGEQELEHSAYDQGVRLQVTRLLDKARFYTDWALKILDPATPLGAAYFPAFESDRLLWEKLGGLCGGSRAELIAAVHAAEPEKLKAVRNGSDDPNKSLLQELRKFSKKALADIKKLFDRDDADLLTGQALAEPMVRALVRAVREFSKRYDEKKAAAHGLDFNDLEHLTIRLLYDSPGVLSAHAAELAAGFDEILVDEYQDTNEVQDAIFRGLSQNGENLFYVGDVKQSIYSFRQACPRLFIEQRARGCVYDGQHFPATVTLGNNFRSRREVTGTVNFLFSLLMREEFGGIEYNENEELVCSAAYPETEEGVCNTELTLINLGEYSRGDYGDIAEAQSIAADIERLMRTMPVTDGGCQRAARYSDFCILLRSKKAHADAYVKVLNAHGIPAYSSGRGGFFTAPEIGVVLSLLRFLDNPTLDIPLAALMMSPLYRFTVDDMARIRLNDRYSTLIAAVQKTARQTTALGDRCRAFLAQTGHWRTVAPVLTVGRLLERLYDESGITDIYGVQKSGRQRVANLQQLFAMAQSFEENGYRGLSAFVRMCDRMEEAGQDTDPAAVAGGVLDGVPVISIHHSKGLEFPVVFLAGGAVPFSSEDTKGDMLLHREVGLGLRLHDHETLIKYETPARLAAQSRIRFENDEEELRVLYVALTRAKEKLCIVSADVNMPGKIAGRAIPLLGEPHLPVFSLASANTFQDWILSAAALHPSGKRLREIAGIDEDSVRETEAPLTVRLTDFQPEETAAPGETPEENASLDAGLAEKWRERLAWRYPYRMLKDIPNKLAAADIAHREQSDEYIATAKPAFLQKGGLSPAGRGTAMHQFMQFADYVAASHSVTGERDRLAASGWLTQKQADSLDVARLERFFAGGLYRRMANAERLMRELPFVAERPAAELFPERALTGEAANESIAVQGVADCVFVEDGEIVIVDYKTDRVQTAEALRDRYAAQVRIYAKAMKEALGLPVRACLLWSFALGREVDVPFE